MYRVDLTREDAFEEFRDAARALIGAGVPPADVNWRVGTGDLLGGELPPQSGATFNVPAAYVPLAEAVVCHSDPERFALLYELLWRITHGERQLLAMASDPLVHRVRRMEKSVRRDMHKMTAFGERTRQMVASPPTVPRNARGIDLPALNEAEELVSLAAVRNAAARCERCPLYKNATQTVFGEGPVDAPVVFVGEQPGDQEDLAGKPFVGPAGQMFDRAFAEAGIDRSRVYVTNAVKHFKFEPRGKRRIHQKPNNAEIDACRWWLDKELHLIKPRLTVALGATAARALTGRDTTISRARGRMMPLRDGVEGFITVHPSFLLRLPDEASKAREYQRFVADLRQVAQHLPEIRKAA